MAPDAWIVLRLLLPLAFGAVDPAVNETDSADDARFRVCVRRYAHQLQAFNDTPAIRIRSEALLDGLDERIRATRNSSVLASATPLFIGAGFGSSGTRTLALVLARNGLVVYHASDILAPKQLVFGPVTRRHSAFTHKWRHPIVAAERASAGNANGNSDDDIRRCHHSLNGVDWGAAFGSHSTTLLKPHGARRPDAIVDMPTAEYLLDLIRAVPNYGALLTLRAPSSWVEARRLHCGNAHRCGMRAPIDRPCGLKMQHLGAAVTAKLYTLHTELVQCVVPPERLLVINYTKRPTDEQLDLMVLQFISPPGAPKKQLLPVILDHGVTAAAVKNSMLANWMYRTCCRGEPLAPAFAADCVAFSRPRLDARCRARAQRMANSKSRPARALAVFF